MADNRPLENSSVPRPLPTVTGRPFYQYDPLPGESYIRVLDLKPGKKDSHGLSGSLKTFKFEEAPPLEAISYVWGSSITDEWIVVDGRQLPITTSMADALRQARRRRSCRMLWADSICINQRDEVEKGHQVSLMGRIYAKSQRTLICLGPGLDSGGRQHACKVAALIRDVNEMMDREFSNPKFSWAWNSFPYPEDNDPLVLDGRWASWVELGECKWFSRGWVVQEVELAPEAVVLWAGCEIQWSTVLRAYQWWARRAAHLMPSYVPTLPVLNEAHRHSWRYKRKEEARTLFLELDRERLNPMTTISIFNYVRVLDLSEPKDRIYAFMAMPTLNNVLGKMRLKPDYSRGKSFLEVYQEFAVKYLQETSDLDLLALVEHDGDCLNHAEGHGVSSLASSFPSWVPCWQCGRDVTSWRDDDVPKIQSDTAPDVATVLDGAILSVRAVILGSVQYVSRRFKDTRQASEAAQEMVSLLREVAPRSLKHPGPHRSTFHIAQAFLHTARQGMYDGEKGEFDKSDDAFARLLEHDEPTLAINTYAHDKSAQRVSQLTIHMSRNRRFVILSRGYFGLAPQATREDDVCAIIFGTRTPFILRRVTAKENHYQVVGAAFVQSRVCISGGRSWPLGRYDFCRDWEEWDLPTEDIFLC